MQTPSGSPVVAHRPAAQNQAPDLEDATDIIPYSSDAGAAPNMHSGVPQSNSDVGNDMSSRDDGPSTRWAPVMQAQQAAMVRAFYGRCRDSWAAIMSTQQQGHTRTAGGMRRAGTQEEEDAARALLRGWEDCPPEVRWLPSCA